MTVKLCSFTMQNMYMNACIQDFTKICNSMIKNYKRVGAKRPGGNGIGAKRLGCGGETTKEENRGETTWGGGVEWLGGETSCYPEAVLTRSIFSETLEHHKQVRQNGYRRIKS